MADLPCGARARLFLVATALAAALFGCTPSTFVVQGYEGPPRPPERLSILRVNGAGGVQLLQVDAEAADVPVSHDARLHIELLPGEHELVLLNPSAGGFAEPVSFVAEAGRVYRPGFARLGEPSATPRARVYEVDAKSDAVRRDVTKRGTGTGELGELGELAPAFAPTKPATPVPAKSAP